MRVIYIILGIFSALIALVLSIYPFGLIALIPAVLAFVFGLLGISASKKEAKSKTPVKLIFAITIIALVLTTYRSIFNENKIEVDTEFIEKEKISEDELQELEDIEIDTSGSN